MSAPFIRTPRGFITTDRNGKASLEWNTNFQSKWQDRYSNAQKFVDSEILRLSEPYIPLRTGVLIKSGVLGTHIGSGLVQWIAPYAKAQYYMKRKKPSITGPLRGPYWFERMKEVWRNTIIEGAKKKAGGK